MPSASFYVFSALLVSALAQPECMQGFPKVTPEQCCPGVTPPYITKGPQCGLPDPASGPPTSIPSCESIKCTMKDYIGSDGKIDSSAFISGMQSYYTTDALKAAVPTAFQNCIGLENSSNSPCPIARVGGCFMMEMVKACPDNGNSDCATAKSMIEKCGPPKN